MDAPLIVCPICDRENRAEHLNEGWRLCVACWHAFRLNENGELISWAPTNKSGDSSRHPRIPNPKSQITIHESKEQPTWATSS